MKEIHSIWGYKPKIYSFHQQFEPYVSNAQKPMSKFESSIELKFDKKNSPKKNEHDTKLKMIRKFRENKTVVWDWKVMIAEESKGFEIE